MDLVDLSGPRNQTYKNVSAEKYIVEGLTPSRSYSFRVAAVNTVGMGPFSDAVTISTLEISKS